MPHPTSRDYGKYKVDVHGEHNVNGVSAHASHPCADYEQEIDDMDGRAYGAQRDMRSSM